MRSMLNLVKTRQRLAGDACQYARKRFKHGYVLTELCQHSGSFQTDVSAAYHTDLFNPGQLVRDSVDVGARSHSAHASQTMP